MLIPIAQFSIKKVEVLNLRLAEGFGTYLDCVLCDFVAKNGEELQAHYEKKHADNPR